MLPVPLATDERDDVKACPDDRPDLGCGEPRLLLELAPDRILGALTRLDAASRRRPERSPGKLEADEQDAVVRVDDDRTGSGTDAELGQAGSLSHEEGRGLDLSQCRAVLSPRNSRNQRSLSAQGTAAFAGEVEGRTKSRVSPRRRSCSPCSGRSRNVPL